MINIEKFLSGYIDCALWSSVDTYEDTGEFYSLDSEFSSVSDNCKTEMLDDCKDFLHHNTDNLLKFKELAECDDERLGMLFWLNRNRHGSGYWDELVNDHAYIGETLSDACKPYGSFDLYGDFGSGMVRSHYG